MSTDRRARFPHVVALDGLRGVAVAAVVVYHLWPGALPGGFIGVDVFMVLSGFLLSSLLVHTVASTGTVSFGAFLLARFRRLLPALLLLLVAVSAYAAVAMPALEAGRVREHTVASLAYVANWRFVIDGTTYTDVVAGASPLRHLWSLSIEEQFYVVLAVAVVLLVRACRGDAARLRRWLGGGAALLAVASAAWMATLHLAGADHARIYFGTDTRVQTLLAGVVLGSALVGRSPSGRFAAPSGVGAVVGAAVLVVVAVTARESAGWMYLGGFTMVAVAGAAVVGGVQQSPLRRLLELRPVVALGVISYGVYLWHWPIIVLATEARTGVSGSALPVLQLLATVALATASYHLVERPVRRGALGVLVGRPALLAGPVAVVAVLALAVAATRPDGPTLAVPPASTATATTATPATTTTTVAPDGSSTGASTIVEATSTTELTTGLTTGLEPGLEPGSTTSPPTPTATIDAPPAASRRVVVVGDSVAHTLAGGHVGEFPEFTPWRPDQSPYDPARIELVSIAKPACTFLPEPVAVPAHDGSYSTVTFESFCGDWRGELRAALDAGADDVIVALSNDLMDRVIGGDLVRLGSPRHDAALLGLLDELRAEARSSGARLAVVALPPRVGHAVDPAGDHERAHARLLATYVADRPDVVLVDLGPVVCPDDRCLDWRYDGWHFTPDGARQVADAVTARLADTTD